jgi:hypothetical protein
MHYAISRRASATATRTRADARVKNASRAILIFRAVKSVSVTDLANDAKIMASAWTATATPKVTFAKDAKKDTLARH